MQPFLWQVVCENTDKFVGQLVNQFRKLFKENHTVHDLEVKIELKLGHKPLQQKDAEYHYICKKRWTKNSKN